LPYQCICPSSKYVHPHIYLRLRISFSFQRDLEEIKKSAHNRIGYRQLNKAGCGDEERGASGINWQQTATLCHKMFIS